MKDKEYTEGIAVRGRFMSWLDNYWYHYKWPTIIGAFFLAVVIICTVQSCTKDDYDLTVVYAGREALTSTERENIRAAIAASAPEDMGKKGELSVGFNAYNILSKEQITELRAQTGADGRPVHVDNSFHTAEYDTYSDYINTGDCAILLLEPWEFEALVSAERLMPLTEVLGYTPEGAISNCGIKLGDTKLYAEYDVMKALPEDTVICIMKPLVWGRTKNEKNYAMDKKLFEAMITPKAEQTEGEGA
ncbi:MAG: hypothetical protein E7653_07035 [Ruminococcaceae bacterium]|nr:hypothetical protein [Oscillospiraceae bacterium]